MIERATIDRILDAVRIEEVVGDFVALRKRGSNYLGLCPFHADKNPSLSVSSTKGIFKCFSCGKAGTAVSFLMDHEHLSYVEALRYLAKKYNIEIEEKEESEEEAASRLRYESLLVVSDFAKKHFENVLWNTPVGRNVGLTYLRERRFSDETIRNFGLGYASDRALSLSQEALRSGYKQEYLVAAGLSVEREDGTIADRFYDRVMFPIHSISGRVIAFGGRTLSQEKTVAKYINSPQSEIYDKSNSLYGIYQAKSSIARQDRCILVEGYADVISMHQRGITNVVASSGTSLTTGQIRLIKRFTSNILLIYDGDEAGIKAALRGTDLILEEGMAVKVVLLPENEDPDSFARAHQKLEIEEYIAGNEVDFIEFKAEMLSREAAGDPIQKARMINDIIKTISVIPDAILRNVYAEAVAGRFEQKVEDILLKIASLRESRLNAAMNARNYGADGSGGRREVQPSYAQEVEPEGEQQPREASNPYLDALEREIVYYLVKFGYYRIDTKDDPWAAYSQPEVPGQTIAQFIRDSLEYDDLVIENPLYRRMYTEFFAFEPPMSITSPEEVQGSVIRHFQGLEDRAMVQLCLDFILDTHALTIKEYRRTLSPEESKLSEVVPKTIIRYKRRIIEQKCIAATHDISEAEKRGDTEELARLVSLLQVYNRIKIQLAEELEKL